MIYISSADNLERLLIATRALSLISAVAAAGVMCLSIAETVGYFSAVWPIGILAGMAQLLLTAATFTAPALTIKYWRSPGVQICAIALNFFLVWFGLTVGATSGGLIVEIVSKIVSRSI